MNSWKIKGILAAVGIATAALSTAAFATVTTIQDSALVSSTQYYTDIIGGGIGSTVMARNDDGFSAVQNLGFTLHFFGQDYTQFYINNNGNISFNNGISTFTPTGVIGVNQPIISPFFADVDTRGGTDPDDQVYLRTDIPNEIIVTWDDVGYFGEHLDKRDSFQLVLRGPDFTIPTGEGAIGFFYKGMQWETGDASGGSHGFGGTPAAVGFGDGLGGGETLASSTHAGISRIVNDSHIWFDQNLAPVPPSSTPPPPHVGVPEPAALGMFGLGLLLIGGFVALRRRKVYA